MPVRWARILLAVFAFAASHVVAAQPAYPTIDQLDHTVWTLRDGAPSFVDALAQTADGVLWLGTNSGLYRFDGVRFEQFKPPAKQSFVSSAISRLTAMPDGSLWVGFTAGDVRVLTRDTIITYAPATRRPGRITGIVRDSTGDTWIASMTGIARLHAGRWQQMGPSERYPGGAATNLLVDTRGTVWAATESGAYVLPRGAREFVRQAVPPNATQGGFRSPREAPDGSVWGVSLSLGLSRLSDSAGRPVDSRSEADGVGQSISSYVDRHGSAWIYGVKPGLLRVRLPTSGDRSRPTAERVALTNGPNVSAFFEDADSNMWVGTGGGVERFRQTALTPVLLRNDARWLALAPAPDGSMWMGSASEPVSSITGNKVHTPRDGPMNITCVLRDFDGGVWFGGAGKIWHLPANTLPAAAHLQPVPLPTAGTFGTIVAMARTPDGDLWVSNASTETMRGIFRLRRGVWSRAPLPDVVSHEPSLSMVADSAGQIWLGSGNRLIRVQGDSMRAYLDSAHFRPASIMALQPHGDRLWIGAKAGVAVLQRNRIRPILATTPIRNVTGIVETANGDVWLNTSSGVARIAAAEVARALTDSMYRVNMERFDEHDGLAGVPVQAVPRPTAVEGTDGRLWFTTSTSVAWIDPAQTVQNRKPPPVEIRSLTAGGKTYDAARRVSLPMRTTQLQLTYTAINLAKPNGLVFRYRLSGVDTAWVDVGTRREAFYTNLKPGSYHFSVSAANEDLVWNDAGASVDFEIPPAFAQTKAFIGALVGLIALTLLGAGWLLALWRHRQMGRALHAKFEGQLAERARVARELHDTLLGDMIGVALQLSVAANRTATTDDKDLLSSLSKQVQHTVVEARRSVSAIRTAPEKPVPLHEQLAATAHRTFHDTSIVVRVAHSGSPRTYADELESQIAAIAAEAMTNALRHGNCHTVTVSCAYAAQHVHVRVRDDGDGFDSSRATPTGHWGLIGMRERAAGIGATLSITSKPGAGTEVSISAHHAPMVTRS